MLRAPAGNAVVVQVAWCEPLIVLAAHPLIVVKPSLKSTVPPSSKVMADELDTVAVKLASPRSSTVIVCVPAVSEVVASLLTQALLASAQPTLASVLVAPICVPVFAGPSQNF